MKRRALERVLFIALLSTTLVTICAQTNTIIVPKEAQTAFCDSSIYGFALDRRYAEQIYAPSEFAAAVADTIIITEVAFRADESYAEDLNATWESIIMYMNVFPGSMEEIVKRQSGVTNPITVFGKSPVQLTGRTKLLDAFDLRFSLRKPFSYDRRLGPLVLSFFSVGPTQALDAQGVPVVGGVSDRGLFIYTQGGFDPEVVLHPAVAVTEFSYITKWAQITAIRRLSSSLQLVFSVIGPPLSSVKVESAPAVAGTYTEESVQFVAAADGQIAVELPLPARSRFYRVALN